MEALALSSMEWSLLDLFQRDFPLAPEPYAALADRLQTSEPVVRSLLAGLRLRGAISRIGAVFRPNTVGASTLAALSVPADRLEPVAAAVSAFAEVNHNYQRDHAYNLWFVVTASCARRVEEVLAEICEAVGEMPLNLPLVEDFHIDLGFPLRRQRVEGDAREATAAADGPPPHAPPSDRDLALVAALAGGLPLIRRPYAAVGSAIDMPEGEVLARLAGMLRSGVMRRFGVVVRHHELGYAANAMAVWDVPDDRVSEIGRALALSQDVTLCYRRRRALPVWPYNLFCMIHGQDRDVVAAGLRRLIERHRLDGFANKVLFSTRRFKQCGALYGRAV